MTTDVRQPRSQPHSPFLLHVTTQLDPQPRVLAPGGQGQLWFCSPLASSTEHREIIGGHRLCSEYLCQALAGREMFLYGSQGRQRCPHTWEGEKGRVLTGVLFGVRLLQESRKDRLALFSVTGDRATRRFFCRLSTEGGVPKPEPPNSVLGEMGISSPRLLRLRSEIVWPSRRYSVTLGPGVEAWWDDSASCCCCCCDVWGCTGLLLTLPSADGSSGRSNLLRSHQASGSCQKGRLKVLLIQ